MNSAFGAPPGRHARLKLNRAGAFCIFFVMFFPVLLRGETICLEVKPQGRSPALTLAAPGRHVRLSFRHSLYGSMVQEEFRAARAGLELVRLYYSEERLVEFYGYEAARREGRWWVVEPKLRNVPSLDLRVSRDSAMRISTDSGTIALSDVVETGGLVRISVSRCDGSPMNDE